MASQEAVETCEEKGTGTSRPRELATRGDGGSEPVPFSSASAGAVDAATRPAPAESGAPPSPRAVVLIGAEGIGTGDETLGRILMRAFLKTLKDLEPPPAAMIFVNAGVHLTTAGSPLLDDIRALENRGTRVLSCGTCLDYFHKLDALKVGSVSNMYEIASSLLTADRVVRP